jgi:hypothetical protein
MLLSLAQWLQTQSPEFGAFRVFQYLTFRAVMAAMTALLIGSALLMLSAFWHVSRAGVVGRLPVSWQQKLPPLR